MENIFAAILAVTGILEISVLIYLLSSPRRGKRKPFIPQLEKLNIFLALFFGITLITFFVLNGPSYIENITFDIRSIFGGETYEVTDDPIFTLPTASGANTSNEGSSSLAVPNVVVLPKGSQLEISIPKLGVQAPIIFPADTSTKGVLKSLEDGVGIYPGSVMPGERGHTILLGHSSRASWYNGDYARVFALLNQLKTGDEFIVTSQDIKYVYRVSSNKVFKPTAADSYLAGAVNGSVMELVTCDPVGSAANRRIVSADLIAGGQ